MTHIWVIKHVCDLTEVNFQVVISVACTYIQMLGIAYGWPEANNLSNLAEEL